MFDWIIHTIGWTVIAIILYCIAVVFLMRFFQWVAQTDKDIEETERRYEEQARLKREERAKGN